MTAPVWLPAPGQELLLRAALLEGPAAGEAWSRWQEDHAEGYFDMGSFRLLPLVYRNLAAQGGDHPWLGRLRGIYRRSWFMNQSLFQHAAGVVARLEAAGIPTLMVKGVALALAHYRDVGARPMDDVDVAVPLEHAEAAIAVLRDDGLRPLRTLTPGVVAVSHAETFRDDGDQTIDLHWDLLRWSGRDDPFWDAAVPVDLRGVATRAPSATDQVLLVAAHGAYWNAVHPMRWVADLHVLLRAPIDWARLEWLAAERELSAPLAHALAYVGGRFAAAVPEGVVARLSAHPARPLRRVALRVSGLPPSPRRSGGLLAVYLDAYLSRTRQRGHRATPSGFVLFLQHHLEVDDRRQLVIRMARGASRNAGLPPLVDARAIFRGGD